MEPMPPKYIIGFSQSDHAQSLDAIGLLAQRLHKLVAHNIAIPLGFAITSHAFDDFLIANNLIEFISMRINNTDYSNHAEIKHNAEEIQKAIRAGHMPDIIKDPVLKAYSGLGYNDPLVILKQSPVDAALAEELVTPEPALVYAKGEQNLLEQIKGRWALLFSVEAMFYRAESGYEGDLSDAIVVQRTVQAESSGLLLTVDLVNKYSDIIEIQAILGQYETILKHELVPDSYYVNKKTEEIIQKKIVDQDWMLIKRGRNIQDLDQRITLSAIWSKQQKLDDTNILKLARQATQIERIFSRAQRILWAAEAGKIFILDTQQLDFEDELHISSADQDAPDEAAELPKPLPAVKKREGKKDIDDYVREIQNEEAPSVEVAAVKQGLLTITMREQDVEVDTSTGVWETFSPALGTLGKYTKGAYLNMAELYLALGYEKSEVVHDRKTKIAFLEDCVAYLKPLLERLTKRPLLLQLSASQESSEGLLLENKAVQDADYRLLRIELELVAVLRNREGLRNLWVVFSDVTSPEHLATLKSEVSNAGCRRSSTFRIFASLERAVSYLNIRELCEVGMDGFVLDVPGLLAQLYAAESAMMTDSLRSFSGFVVSQINKSRMSSIALLSDRLENEKLIKVLVENAVSDLIMPPSMLQRTLPKIASQEVKKLKTVKRGRKKKQIDYGF